jgi:hypothetical protein
MDLARLVRADSPFISPSAFDPQELWHSDMGRLEGTDEGYRRLINVRVDVVDGPLTNGSMGRIVAIYTMAQDSPIPGQVEDSSQLRSVAGSLAALERQHDLLKSILGRVISSEAASRISLQEEE